jgi:hypothetical protein
MTEEFEQLEEVEEISTVEESRPCPKRGCRTAIALLVVLLLLFSAAVPFTRFVIRKSYEKQVEEFPKIVCANLSEAGQMEPGCDPLLEINMFVPRTFPLGTTKNSVASAMKGLAFKEQTGISQPTCLQPTIWTYDVAKSSLGWHTEVEFLFCSGLLVERMVFVDGKPISLPTYDL